MKWVFALATSLFEVILHYNYSFVKNIRYRTSDRQLSPQEEVRQGHLFSRNTLHLRNQLLKKYIVSCVLNQTDRKIDIIKEEVARKYKGNRSMSPPKTSSKV